MGDFTEKVQHVVKSCSKICNMVLRGLCVKNETTYLKLYVSNVIPIVMYANQIWRPSKICDIELLERMQRILFRKVEFGYNFERGSLKIRTVVDRF